jgi:hypothetical protein
VFRSVPDAEADEAREGSWDIVSWWRSYLVSKSSNAGDSVDGPACPLHCPTARSHQTRGQGFLPGIVLSRHAAVGGGALLGDTQPLVWGSCRDVDCLGTCITDFYIGCMVFTKICLPHIGIVTVHMRVFMVKLSV